MNNKPKKDSKKRFAERKRLEDEYRQKRKDYFGYYGIPDFDTEPVVPDKYEESLIFGRLALHRTIEDHVRYGLRRFDEAQHKIPTKKFRDRNQEYYEYQQKYLEILIDTTPEATEILREGVESFNALFGEHGEDCREIIHNLMFGFERPRYYSNEVKYRPIENEYLFGSDKALVDLFNILNIENTKIPESFSQLWDGLVAIHGEDDACRITLDSMKDFQNVTQKIFQSIAPDPKVILPNFFKLQTLIYEWVSKYNLHKDWIFYRAYSIIFQLSVIEKTSIAESKEQPSEKKREKKEKHLSNKISIDLPEFKPETDFRSWEFLAEGWKAHIEEGSTYKKKLLEEFSKAIDSYLCNSVEPNTFSRLVKLRESSTPPNYKEIKWLLARNEGAAYSQIAKVMLGSHKREQEIEDSIKEIVRKFNLPRFKGRGIGITLKRLREIKAATIRG